jgi:hypothetical protein
VSAPPTLSQPHLTPPPPTLLHLTPTPSTPPPHFTPPPPTPPRLTPTPPMPLLQTHLIEPPPTPSTPSPLASSASQSPPQLLPQQPVCMATSESPPPQLWPIWLPSPNDTQVVPATNLQRGNSATKLTLQEPPLNTSSWPQHMVDVYRYLMLEPASLEMGSSAGVDRNWGEGWLSCVHEFVQFQKMSAFPVRDFSIIGYYP